MFRILDWFRTPARRRPPATFRPLLEGLQERVVPNASRTYDASGQLYEFVNYADGTLYRYDQTGAHFQHSDVRWVSTFTDSSGQMGFDVVFAQGLWVEYDAAGGHQLGSDLSTVSTAFDGQGHQVRELVDQSGNWVESTDGTLQQQQASVRSATVAFDALGRKTIDYVRNYFSFGSVSFYSTGVWFERDAAGDHTMGVSANGSSFGPYAQPAVEGPKAFWAIATGYDPLSGQVVKDIFRRDGSWEFYDATGQHVLAGPGTLKAI
jgi:hypothetical protein